MDYSLEYLDTFLRGQNAIQHRMILLQSNAQHLGHVSSPSGSEIELIHILHSGELLKITFKVFVQNKSSFQVVGHTSNLPVMVEPGEIFTWTE